jgi:hypothetical protein
MNTYIDKNQNAANQLDKGGKSQAQGSGESIFQFVDNRPEAIAQRKLQESSHNNPHPIQMWTATRSATKGLASTMGDKRVEAGFWNKSGMTKNFAFDKDDTGNWAHSQENRHAEPGILISSLAKYPGADINLVTERYPCEWCQSDIERAEEDGDIDVNVKYFVDHDDNAKDNLISLYQKWWRFGR